MQAGEIAARSRGRTAPTDVSNPQYFHKVVDCQWACPTHTPVPEYIRLIAQGRYAAAYMLNWESNVFPGILGRVCDRPCEPACRRGRVEEKPVAICRLKRVAADYKGEIDAFMPESRWRRTASVSRSSAPAPPRSRWRATCCRSGTRACCSRRTQGRRADAHQHSLLPPAGDGAGRRDRPHRAHGHRDPLRPRDQEPRGAAEGRLRCRLHRHRCPQGQRPRYPRPQGSQGQHPHRHRLAHLRRLRACAHRRQARGGDRWRQHGHGLLPHLASDSAAWTSRSPSARRGA